MASPRDATRPVRILRWQERNERQVWLLAAVSGLIVGSVYGILTGLSEGLQHGAVGGLFFGGPYAITWGLMRRHRLRKRRAAQAAMEQALKPDKVHGYPWT